MTPTDGLGAGVMRLIVWHSWWKAISQARLPPGEGLLHGSYQDQGKLICPFSPGSL